MDGFTWVRHKDHGGYWRCPDGALDEMAALGWEPSEAPEEVNPAVAERIAWEREQAAEAAAREAENAKTTKPARRGESKEESES
jgi:hypothetical protein